MVHLQRELLFQYFRQQKSSHMRSVQYLRLLNPMAPLLRQVSVDVYKRQGHNRPNQGGRRNLSRIPKALQKPTPQPKQEEKKPEVKEITLPEKMTIRELAEAMKRCV